MISYMNVKMILNVTRNERKNNIQVNVEHGYSRMIFQNNTEQFTF